MEKVGSHEAKTNLSKLLDKLAQGQRITITKHGVPVAVLVPACAQEKGPKEVIQEIRALRRKVSLRGLSLRKMIKEGGVSDTICIRLLSQLFGVDHNFLPGILIKQDERLFSSRPKFEGT